MRWSGGLAVVFAVGAAGGLGACVAGTVERLVAQTDPAPREAPSGEGEIYALLVAHALDGGRPDTLLLATESPAYRELPADSFMRRSKEVVPPPLPARLSALSAARTAVSVEALPSPARTIPEVHARRVAAERLGGMKVLAITPVAFSDDSTQALVYYETWCGRVCGGGYELWLVRGPDGRWRLRQELTHWIS